jgi:phosphatidylglycerol:prolipoprotein diacylglycerol transferase
VIEIVPQNRPVEYADATTFHPAFLYESVWDALVCLVLLCVARRFADRLRTGDVFLLYLGLYSAGRFLVETLRVDDMFLIGDAVRGNLVVSGALAVVAALVLLLRHSRRGKTRPKTG